MKTKVFVAIHTEFSIGGAFGCGKRWRKLSASPLVRPAPRYPCLDMFAHRVRESSSQRPNFSCETRRIALVICC